MTQPVQNKITLSKLKAIRLILKTDVIKAFEVTTQAGYIIVQREQLLYLFHFLLSETADEYISLLPEHEELLTTEHEVQQLGHVMTVGEHLDLLIAYNKHFFKYST